MPGFLDATREWFKVYKVADGKPLNEFAFDGEFQNRDFALGVIEETHGYWNKLIAEGHGELSMYADFMEFGCMNRPCLTSHSSLARSKNTTLKGTPQNMSDSDANAVLGKAPAGANAAELPVDGVWPRLFYHVGATGC